MTQKGTVQQGRRREAEFEAETSLSPGSAFWGRCRAGYLHGSLCQVGRTPHGDWRFRVREPPAPASSPVWPDLLSPARGQLENRTTRRTRECPCVPSTRSATSDYFSAAAPIRNRAIKSDD